MPGVIRAKKKSIVNPNGFVILYEPIWLEAPRCPPLPAAESTKAATTSQEESEPSPRWLRGASKTWCCLRVALRRAVSLQLYPSLILRRAATPSSAGISQQKRIWALSTTPKL